MTKKIKIPSSELEKMLDVLNNGVVMLPESIERMRFQDYNESGITGQHPEFIISDMPPTKWQIFLHSLNPFARRERKRVFKLFEKKYCNCDSPALGNVSSIRYKLFGPACRTCGNGFKKDYLFYPNEIFEEQNNKH